MSIPEPQFPSPRSARVHVRVGALTHQGKVRTNNEDHYLVANFGRWLRPLASNLAPEFALPPHEEIGCGLVVADGIGGSVAGEVASREAIRDLHRQVVETPDWILATDELWAEHIMMRMLRRFRTIDERLFQQARNNPDLQAMGTTMTVACTLGLDLIFCHIGDSRAYLLRHGLLRQLTRDMTMAQELVELGKLSAAEAARHRLRHVLTQSLGAGEPPATQVQRLILRDGDRLLLCTDGLTEMVRDAQITQVLAKTDAPQAACQALVDLALAAGGKDNVTVVLADYRVREGAPAVEFGG